MAMILAGTAALRYAEGEHTSTVARAIYESLFEAVNAGIRTLDLGGSNTTTGFTDEIIRCVAAKLEVWEALGE
jgi:isocitrate dehydrogenase (NAD+)